MKIFNSFLKENVGRNRRKLGRSERDFSTKLSNQLNLAAKNNPPKIPQETNKQEINQFGKSNKVRRVCLLSETNFPFKFQKIEIIIFKE